MTTISTPVPAHSHHRGPAVFAAFVAVAAVGIAAWAYVGQGSDNPTPAQPTESTTNASVDAVPNELTIQEELQIIRDGSGQAGVSANEPTMSEEVQLIKDGSINASVGSTQFSLAEEIQLLRDSSTKASNSPTNLTMAEELQKIKEGAGQ